MVLARFGEMFFDRLELELGEPFRDAVSCDFRFLGIAPTPWLCSNECHNNQDGFRFQFHEVGAK
jgi:hypothetical protein